jgi:hypothetical protein
MRRILQRIDDVEVREEIHLDPDRMGCTSNRGKDRRLFRLRLDEELDAAHARPRATVCPGAGRTGWRCALCHGRAGGEHEEQKKQQCA